MTVIPILSKLTTGSNALICAEIVTFQSRIYVMFALCNLKPKYGETEREPLTVFRAGNKPFFTPSTTADSKFWLSDFTVCR